MIATQQQDMMGIPQEKANALRELCIDIVQMSFKLKEEVGGWQAGEIEQKVIEILRLMSIESAADTLSFTRPILLDYESFLGGLVAVARTGKPIGALAEEVVKLIIKSESLAAELEGLVGTGR